MAVLFALPAELFDIEYLYSKCYQSYTWLIEQLVHVERLLNALFYKYKCFCFPASIWYIDSNILDTKWLACKNILANI